MVCAAAQAAEKAPKIIVEINYYSLPAKCVTKFRPDDEQACEFRTRGQKRFFLTKVWKQVGSDGSAVLNEI